MIKKIIHGLKSHLKRINHRVRRHSSITNTEKVSLKDSIKLLYFQQAIFYFIFISLNILFYFIYSHNLTIFALNAKDFLFENNPTTYLSSVILTEKFQCSSQYDYFLCREDKWIFLTILLFVEFYAIRKIIFYWKKINKLNLLIYLLFMQVFSILAFLVLGYTPDLVFSSLSKRANKEIVNTIHILNAPEKISKQEVISSPNEIASRIDNSDFINFRIVEKNPLKGALLGYLKISNKSKDTLYRAISIPYEIDSPEFENTNLTFNTLLFRDNTIVVNRINQQLVEKIVPPLTKRMIESEIKLPSTSKKPSILFLNEVEYYIYQSKQEEKIKKEFEIYFASQDSFINESNSIIQINQNIVNSYQTDKQKAQKELDEYSSKYRNWYQDCKRDFGSSQDCEGGKNIIDSSIRDLEANLRFVDENRNIAQTNLTIQLGYKNESLKELEFSKQNYNDFLNNPITAAYQDGVFNPPDKIYIRYKEITKMPLTHYLDTTLHEQFHFYSYNTENEFESFLNEGMTDYFKSNTLSKYIDKDSIELGYPYEVSIIEDLTKHFPYEKIKHLYLNKDISGFKSLFMEKYGPNDYENFIRIGRNLTYLSIKDEGLKSELKQRYLLEMENILNGNNK